MNLFPGLQFLQSKKEFIIHQSKYVNDMIKKFYLEDFKPICTPMTIICKPSKEDESKDVDPKCYRSMIGSLLYVTAFRPEVKKAVGMMARFQDGPKQIHVQDVKRIFRYLKGAIDF